MPPGRANNLKRQSDASNVPGEDASPKVKLPRLERGPDDFSGIVKTKLQSYTRTGQACDRCKVRKIRCDALPEGCSHCATMNLECYVTDRVSGRTERRGYLQQLEREKGAMLAHIRSLEKLLESNGVEVRPWQFPGYNNTYPPGMVLDQMGNPVQDANAKDQWQQVGLVWVKGERNKPPPPPSSEKSGNGSSRSSALESRPHATDAHLGVSSDKEPLSSIKGTTLSILGTTLDITAGFETPDMDEPLPGALVGAPLYNKSVMAMFQSTLNVNPPLVGVELPSRDDAFTYSEWYFLMISPFLPILHKPSFIALLTRIYDEPNFKPTIPELVNVHMVFATIYFQYGVRNREKPEQFAQLNDLSNKHYHWSLSKFFDLAVSQSVTAVQALAMVMAHTRNFPKPGCSLTISTFAYMKALELNLHRAVKIPGGGTTLENEIRKRVWWAILAVYTTLNGRLGRPMPVSADEFDVEFPIPIPDEFLGEQGILDASKIGRCNYQVGLQGFKAAPLFMEMYSKLYGARRDPNTYVDVVYDLEEKLRKLLEELPEELRVENAKPGQEVFALYCQAFCLEFTLCVRHPSVCMTDDPKFRADNTRACEETAKKLLKVVSSLRGLRSLDTTWYQLAVYVGAIFSTLVAHWERRYDSTRQEVILLREDMATWLDVIWEIGRLLGTGSRLTTEIRIIVERTIGWIERDRGKQDSDPGHTPIKQQSSPGFPLGSLKAKSDTNTSSGTGTPTDPRAGPATGNEYFELTVPAGATSYPPLAYPDQTQGSNPLQSGVSAAFDSTDGASYLYAAASAATAASASPNATTPAEQANPLIAFASQATQHVAGQTADDWRPHAQAQAAAQMLANAHISSNTWQDWTAAIADAGATSQDRFSANALLNLGTPRPGDITIDQLGHGDVVGVGAQSGAWPLLIFHDGTGVGGAPDGGTSNGA